MDIFQQALVYLYTARLKQLGYTADIEVYKKEDMPVSTLTEEKGV